MQVPLTIADHLERAALVYPERIGVVDEPDQPVPSWGSLTYQRVAELARAQAAALDERGVGRGERVAIVSHNAARLVVSVEEAKARLSSKRTAESSGGISMRLKQILNWFALGELRRESSASVSRCSGFALDAMALRTSCASDRTFFRTRSRSLLQRRTPPPVARRSGIASRASTSTGATA